VSTKTGSKSGIEQAVLRPADVYPHHATQTTSSHTFSFQLGNVCLTFVLQHTVHLAFCLFKPELYRCELEKVSTYSIISGTVSLAVGVFVYMSFGRLPKVIYLKSILQSPVSTWLNYSYV
jgi:hypothetical protein